MPRDIAAIRAALQLKPAKDLPTTEGDLRKLSEVIVELALKGYSAKETVTMLKQEGFGDVSELTMLPHVRQIVKEGRGNNGSNDKTGVKQKKAAMTAGAATKGVKDASKGASAGGEDGVTVGSSDADADPKSDLVAPPTGKGSAVQQQPQRRASTPLKR